MEKRLVSSESDFALIALALASTFFLAVGANAATAASTPADSYVTLYGPARTFAPLFGTKVQTNNFNVSPAPSSGELLVTNGTGEDLSQKSCAGLGLIAKIICVATNVVNAVRLEVERPTSVEIAINGVIVVAPSALPKTVNMLTVPVSLSASNQITLKIKGTIFSSVSLLVRNHDTTPPILALIQPAAGQVIPSLTIGITGTSDKVLASARAQIGSGSSIDLSIATGGLGFSGSATASANGVQTLTVIGRDLSGNESTITSSIDVEFNRPPSASLVLASSGVGLTPLTVQFDASGSSDPDGDAISYSVDFGDGQVATSSTPLFSHVYLIGGNLTATLTVLDARGLSATATVAVTPTVPTIPIAKFQADKSSIFLTEVVSFSAANSQATTPGATIASYEWTAPKGLSVV